jgi:hypothetical protein
LIYCEECKWFWDWEDDRELGECRKHPPVVVLSYNTEMELYEHKSVFPEVDVSDYCSEAESGPN